MASEELAKAQAELVEIEENRRPESAKASEELSKALTRAEEEGLAAVDNLKKERIANLAELSSSQKACRMSLCSHFENIEKWWFLELHLILTKGT